MIEGRVTSRRAYVTLTLRGPGGEGTAEFRLDTGFTGTITLPQDARTALGLTFVRSQPAGVAGGGQVIVEVNEAVVDWDGRRQAVEVLSLPGPPLLGMALLSGHEVCIPVTEGGVVKIEAL